MKEFQIDFVTHDEYAYLAAEISFRGQRVCQVLRASDDRIDIECIEDQRILDPPVVLRFPLDSFVEALAEARRDLMSLEL